MQFANWLRSPKSRTTRPAGRWPRAALRLEALEGRLVPSTFTVNTIDDLSGSPSDGVLSLRQAIAKVNADESDSVASPDVIAFNITSGLDVNGVATIRPLTSLDPFVRPVFINGYSQGQGSAHPALANRNDLHSPDGDNAQIKVFLDGGNAAGIDSLTFNPGADHSEVRGLAVGRFLGAGISINANECTVAGNFIGVDATGENPAGNGEYGILVAHNHPCVNNTIGGTAAADRNVISANGSDDDVGMGIRFLGSSRHLVAGNYIGLDARGTTALGNTNVGVETTEGGGDITVGGTVAGAGNVISGNSGSGIVLGGGLPNLVQGNYIGTDATGMTITGADGKTLGNADRGAEVAGTLGGTVDAARNLISGNKYGVDMDSGVVEGNWIGTDATGGADGISLGNREAGVIAEGTATIGGPATGACNVISGNMDGVRIYTGRPTIQGNYIGTDASGTVGVGNRVGVYVVQGGSPTIAGNVISGNKSNGILLQSSVNTLIQGNRIGTDATGSKALGNGFGDTTGGGITVWLGGSNNTIGGTAAGAGNTIAYNAREGVKVLSGSGNAILGNSIHDNRALGISLDPGADHDARPPMLTAASTSPAGTSISGTLDGTATPGATVLLQFFTNTAPDRKGVAEGRTLLGSRELVVQPDRQFTVTDLPPLPAGEPFLTATATYEAAGDTSPFSPLTAFITLTSDAPGGSYQGQRVTFTASVQTGSVAGTYPTSGMVVFTFNGNTYSRPVALNGTTTLSIPPINSPDGFGPGDYTVVATYQGDSTFLPSSPASLVQHVAKDPVDVQLVSAVGAVAGYDEYVPLTAYVAPTATDYAGPSGTVTFYDNGRPFATESVFQGPPDVPLYFRATTDLGYDSTIGAHHITAHYNEDGGYVPRTDGALDLTITAAPTTTAVSSSSPSAVDGQELTLAAAVTQQAPADGTIKGSIHPSGTATFYDSYNGGTPQLLGTANLDPQGVGRLDIILEGDGAHHITADYQPEVFHDPAGGPDFTSFLPSSGACDQSLFSITIDPSDPSSTSAAAASLLSAIDSSHDQPVTIELDTATAPNAVISVVNAVQLAPSQTATVIVNLPSNVTYSEDLAAQVPAGMTLIIGGDNSQTFVGHSPALTVGSGTVIVTGVNFTTPTASPTILVTGGSLTLRDCTVQESTGSSQAAVAVTGGSVDLGTAADPGGNTININGTGQLIRNTGANPIPALGDSFTVNGTALTNPFRIEDAILGGLDNGGGGPVTYVADNVYVTAQSGSIQRGVNAVAAGGTVNVEPGSYAAYTVGAKPLTVSFLNGPSYRQGADPVYPGTTELVVTGTAANDTIGISPHGNAGAIDVAVNALPVGTFAPTGRIVVYGLAGDDAIQAAGAVGLPTWLFGGDGNDQLGGGNGNNVLVAGAGSDLLVGGSGRDLLVGDAGADRIIGNGGDDILIGGTTAYDANDTALAAIMAEWTSADDFATRVARLTDRFNPYRLVSGQTVFDDSSTDTLTGSSGVDWFFAGTADKATDLSASERAFIFGS